MALLFPCTYTAAGAVTAHASDPRVYDGLWCTVTGNVTITFQQGPSIQFLGVPAGTLLPVKTRLITAITATMIGLVGPSNSFCFNSGFILTDDDTAANIYDAFYINATGGGTNLAVVGRDSSGTVTITVAVGQLIPIRSKLVLAATTATVIGLRF